MSIDLSISPADYKPDDGALTAAHFAVNYTGFRSFEEFKTLYFLSGATNIRWTGGTLSETRPEVYGLDIPGLYDATDLYAHNPDRVRPDLSEMIEFANETQSELSILIPTARYEGDLSTAGAEFTNFLSDLAAGAYGVPGSTFKLEIGNEYYAIMAGGAVAYGEIADAFLSAYAAFLEATGFPPEWDIEIAVQLGHTHDDNSAILTAISDENLALVDDTIAHNQPLRFEAVDKEQAYVTAPEDLGEPKWQNVIDNWDIWAGRFADLGLDAPELSLSEWTVGAAAMDPDDVDLIYQDYGLRQASAALEIFTTYTAAGIDSAALWGLGVDNLNNFGTYSDGAPDLSHGGVLFAWLAEALGGKTVRAGFTENDRADSFMVYGFEDADQLVLFVVANDIDPDGREVRLDLDGYGDFLAVRVDTLRSPDGTTDDRPAEDRLTEGVLVESASWSGYLDQINLDFTADFEVQRVILAKTEDGAQDLGQLADRATERWRMTPDTETVPGGHKEIEFSPVEPPMPMFDPSQDHFEFNACDGTGDWIL